MDLTRPVHRSGLGEPRWRPTAVAALSLVLLIGCSTPSGPENATESVTGPAASDTRVRNAVLPTPQSGSGAGDGRDGTFTRTEPLIPLNVDKFVQADRVMAPLLPTKWIITSAQLKQFEIAATASPLIPVIVQLNVAFDPVERAAVLRKGQTTPSKKPYIAGSNDPQLVAAADELFAWYQKVAGPLDSRRARSTDLFAASAAYWGEAGAKASPGADRSIRASDYAAQLGQGPFMRLLLTIGEVRELGSSGRVANLSVDQMVSPTTGRSTDEIGSVAPARFNGLNGSGTTVAVIDTGVLSSHPAFAGRIVAEACFSGGGDCPGGAVQSDSAAPCTFSAECDHGTHVAGIAMGVAVTAGQMPVSTGEPDLMIWTGGVAPGANLFALNASTQKADGRPGFWGSDLALALGEVANRATRHNVVAVNMSLGSGTSVNGRYTAACDALTDADAVAVRTNIATLLAQNVATVASAGNGSDVDGVGWPACLSEVVAVSNSQGGQVWTSSNVGAITDLFAPGTSINSAIVSGDAMDRPGFGPKTGTSMAAPHVTGAWAILRQIFPDLNVASVLTLLKESGVPLADQRTGGTHTKPRLDLSSSLPVATTWNTSKVTEIPDRRLVISEGAAAVPSRRDGAFEATISVPLDDATRRFLASSQLGYRAVYFTVRGGRATVANVNGRALSPQLIGMSRGACRPEEPLRAYKVLLPLSQLSFYNGVLRTTVIVWTEPGAVMDGASMLLVSPRLQTAAREGVVISEGLAVLSDQSPTVRMDIGSRRDLIGLPASFHLVVADGQDAAETAVGIFTSTISRGRAVTLANRISGSDGAHWDDRTFDLTGLRLTGRPAVAVMGHPRVTTPRDCLAVVAAALNIGRRPTTEADIAPPATELIPSLPSGSGLILQPVTQPLAAPPPERIP
jgi:subtilisin family serine protease